MTGAQLLGFGMSLLLKLSVSVAAVLLVSWAYRFYCSRDSRETQRDRRKPGNATCRSCKTTLSYPDSAKPDREQEERQPRGSRADEGPSPDESNETAADFLLQQAKRETPTPSRCDGSAASKNEARSRQERGEVSNADVWAGSPMKILPHPTESRAACTTGRRSPRCLLNLEGIVGVRRELRQELECQGTYSSFLSKAEIKVEDASMLLEGTGDQTVRRKIYDYYVESSSHCITESDRALGHSQSQPSELRSPGSCHPSPPSPLSPITTRDLISPQSTAEDPSAFEATTPTDPARPPLLRTESYLSATERCELSVPVQTSAVTATAAPSPASNGAESTVAPNVSPEDSKDPNERDTGEFETEARSPRENDSSKHESTFPEKFKSKIDLGNCLEALDLAKKHGQKALQEAALGVMSDNYLQVLREPNVYGWLSAGERDRIQRQRTSGRRFVTVAHIDPQDWSRTSGRPATEGDTSSAIYYYDDHTDAWRSLCLIPQEIVSKACAVCTMDNYVFVAAGCQGTHSGMAPSKRVFCFNPLTSIWKEISPMNEARPCCKLAALEGHIYAIGGECLSSVERYDPREDKWTFVAPLPNNTFAVAHQVAVSNGELYVSGGTFKSMLLCYSPKSNSWRSSLIVGSKDKTADMVAVRKSLYRFDINPILGVSVYRYHTGVRLWYKCSSKRLLRCPAFHCIALDDTIFCVSRQFTMRFVADEVSPAFTDEQLSVLSAAKGTLFPFILSLPDKKPLQTSV